MEVRVALELDQFGLCSYSEIRPDEYGLGVHIEHVEPKSANPSRTFDYSNLALSALSNSDLTNLCRNDQFAGHYKLSNYDSSLFVSCIDEESQEYFAYVSDGRVEPSIVLDDLNRPRAEYTINLLNLNSPYLVNLRKRWLDEMDSLIDEHIDNGWSLYDLAAIDLIPLNGKLSQFFSATRQRFLGVAEELLDDNAKAFK